MPVLPLAAEGPESAQSSDPETGAGTAGRTRLDEDRLAGDKDALALRFLDHALRDPVLSHPPQGNISTAPGPSPPCPDLLPASP